MLVEVLRRSAGTHDYDLFELDAGPHNDTRLPPGPGLPPARVAVVRGPAVGGPLRPAVDVARVVAAERRVARAIDEGGYDLAFVHPSQFTQAPTVLYRLRTPSLYLIQEPRRRSFEAGYRTTVTRSRGVRGLVRGTATSMFDRVVGSLDRRAVAAAGTLVCNSAFSAESVARAYGREARVCLLAVDGDVFRPAEPGASVVTPDLSRPPSSADSALESGARSGGVTSMASGPGDSPTRSPYVVSVGGLDPTKGHDLVVAALGLVPAPSRPELHIVYERSAPDYDRVLEERAEADGVGVHLHPGITDAALVDLYRGAVATVCAARLEPFGLTPLESIGCGTPVIAVNEGGYRETVTPGVNGELVERTPTAIAGAVERAVNKPAGNEQPDPWALHATVSPDWGWDRTVARLHDLMEQAAAERRQGTGVTFARHRPQK